LKNDVKYNDIDWKSVYGIVGKFQHKIAEATNLGEIGKAGAIGRELILTFEARALAVRRVVTNPGKNTPGIDGVIWKTSEDRMKAIRSLTKTGYKASPVRRVYIPKPGSNEKRPLGIPTMKDRAMQALYALALVPIAESTADRTSFGFRPHRSAHDALTYIFDIGQP
jgi:RNA-directed DNA polymerase